VQEDAASFVTRLVDKVMESSRGSPAGAALKAAIYGQTVDQFIGHPPKCNHYKVGEKIHMTSRFHGHPFFFASHAEPVFPPCCVGLHRSARRSLRLSG